MILFNLFVSVCLTFCFSLQPPAYKEPSITIPGSHPIVQHEILNNKRQILTKVNKLIFNAMVRPPLYIKPQILIIYVVFFFFAGRS